MSSKDLKSELSLWIGLIFMLALLPVLVNYSSRWLYTAIYANIFVLFTISWDLFSGHTHYVSLGHGFLIGLSGYSSALLTSILSVPLYLSIPLSCLITCAVAVPIVYPTLRVRGSYFLILSLALPLLMERIVRIGYFIDILGGTFGIYPLELLGPAATPLAIHYFTLVIAVFFGILFWRISKSDFGLKLRCIGEDEELFESCGISATKFKLLGFLICCVSAGLGGALWVHNQGVANPGNTLSVFIMIQILFAVIIGGQGTIIGAFLGSYISWFLLEYLRLFFPGGSERLLVFFLIGTFVMVFFSKGIVPNLLKLVGKLFDRSNQKT